MRGSAVLLGAALLALPARAQVTVNPGALDSLGKPETAPVRRPARPAPRPSPPVAPTPAAPPAKRQPVAGPAAPPPLPQTPPAILAIPAPVAVPTAAPPPPPPIPLADDAPGSASALPNGGLRVTFGQDRWDLNKATDAALLAFGHSHADDPATTINIYAYAAGSAEDQSTPRRLSLSRALTARAALLSQGVASTRIYPRALGPAGGTTDPDRVDVVPGPPGPPAPPLPTKTAAP